MKSSSYISSRGGIEPVSFCQAVMMGLADDGGLILPAAIPDVSDQLDDWRDLSYPELAVKVMTPFIGDDIPAADLAELVKASYSTFTDPEVVPVRQVGPVHIVELFHGPTLAFKDVALQFLGNVFGYILNKSGEKLNIIGATSGDTGSAAIYGVRGKPNIDIFIMHPHGKVSPIQERQMTTVVDENVHNIAIEGTFDDGQRILKELFNDLDFKAEYKLGAVNSVNWARVLAQIVYYFSSAFKVQARTGAKTVQVCVPTGNFGDIFAGYMAKRMGAPISRLILATNENDILSRFFLSGRYEQSQVVPTLSPSMDIQVASNFERYLYYRTGEDAASLKRLMEGFAASGGLSVDGADPLFAAGRGTTETTLATIAKYYREFHYLLDPHTAVGVFVAEEHLSETEPTLCLATAHPAKFKAAIMQALGEDLARHEKIDGLDDLPTRCKILPAHKDQIESFVRETLRDQ
jgi:threonine synthase